MTQLSRKKLRAYLDQERHSSYYDALIELVATNTSVHNMRIDSWMDGDIKGIMVSQKYDYTNGGMYSPFFATVKYPNTEELLIIKYPSHTTTAWTTTFNAIFDLLVYLGWRDNKTKLRDRRFLRISLKEIAFYIQPMENMVFILLENQWSMTNIGFSKIPTLIHSMTMPSKYYDEIMEEIKHINMIDIPEHIALQIGIINHEIRKIHGCDK